MFDYQINEVIQESYRRVCERDRIGKGTDGAKGAKVESRRGRRRRFGGVRPKMDEEYDPNDFKGTAADYLKAGWEGAKEGFSSGVHKTAADIEKGFQRLGSNIARPFVGGEKADEWNAAMDKHVEDVYKKHSLGYDDTFTKLGELGGKMAGTALPLLATGTALKGIGAGLNALGKGGAAASAASTATNASKLSKAAGTVGPWVERGLKWYGPHAIGQEVGDALDELGHKKLAAAARTAGDVIGAKGALGATSTAPLTLGGVLGGGVPGGLGLYMGTKNAAQAAADKGLISKDTQERLNALGAVGGFGAAEGLVGWPAWDYAIEALPEQVKTGMDAVGGGHSDSDSDSDEIDWENISDDELMEIFRRMNGLDGTDGEVS